MTPLPAPSGRGFGPGRAAAPMSQRSSVRERLSREPYRFDFFQAVRLLELAAGEQARHAPKEALAPVGEDYAPQQECIRFAAAATQKFAASAIVDCTARERDGAGNSQLLPAHMTVAFLGLTGPSGVLPQHYTQRLIDQLREDRGMQRFFDLFNHRVLSHFYRAWRKHRMPIAYEASVWRNPERGENLSSHDDSVDLTTFGLLSLIGFGTPGHLGRQELPDEGLLHYSGHFAQRRPQAVSLERMVSEAFAISTKVLQYQGQWLWLDRSDQTQLASVGPHASNNQLGTTALAGQRVWSVENKFRLRLGPLDYADFWEFTPGGRCLTRLSQFVRTYVGLEFDFDVQLVLRRDETPECRLAPAEPGPRLGWNTWIRSRSMTCDPDDAVLRVEGLPTR